MYRCESLAHRAKYMKRIIAIICTLCLLIQPFAAFAADREIMYGKKVANPNLTFPLKESAIMKNGVMVIEAEDLQFNPKVLNIVDDEEASGGKALKQNTSNNTDKSLISGYEMTLDFYNDINASTKYYFWFRLKSNSTFQSVFYDFDYAGKYPNTSMAIRPNSAQLNTYIWKQGFTTTLAKSGQYTLGLVHREGQMSLDKIIITNNSGFKPDGVSPDPFALSDEEGAIGSGEANAVNWRDTSKIKVYPKKDQHPSLYMTPKTIEETKARIEKNEYSKAAFDDILRTANKALPDVDKDTAKYNSYSSFFDICEMRAFAYAFGAIDASLAREAVEFYLEGVEFLSPNWSDSTTASRSAGNAVVYGARLYDWAHDLWTDAERQHWIKFATELQALTETGWPPINRAFYTGHATEAGVFKVALEYAIAVYSEDPSAYDMVAAILYGPMFETLRNFAKGAHNQAPGAYFNARINSTLSEMMFTALGDQYPINETYNNVFTTKIHRMMPNGAYYREDDDYSWQNYSVDTFMDDSYQEHYLYYGYKYDDPIMTRYALLSYAIDSRGKKFTPGWQQLLTIDFDKLSLEDITEYGLTYFTDSPMTTMATRTSWQMGHDSPVATAYINMREFNAHDHGHRDTGGFQIYYKGFLAMDSGYYSYDGGQTHKVNWQDRTIAHNCMLIDNFDPNWYVLSGKNNVNDGGQKRPAGSTTYRKSDFMYDPGRTYAYTKAKYAGPNAKTPTFSYISSDISQAYNDTVRKNYKVETDGYERSMVFIDTLNEDYPAAVIVYDDVTSLDATYKKSWLLHSQQEPIVDAAKGTVTIYRNEYGYNGKLVNKTLTPSVTNSEITVIGGKGREFEVNGVNYPAPLSSFYSDASNQRDRGLWTTYLSPKVESKDDKFLNVMYVSDYDRNLPGPAIYKEFGTVYTGATILDNMVTFSLSRENIQYAFNLNVRNNGYDTVKCLITDLAIGKWQITGNGVNYIVESKQGEHTGYVELAPGSYKVAPVTGGEVTNFDKGAIEKDDFGDFRILADKNLMYQPKPGKLMSGTPYVAVDGIMTQLGNSKITSVSADGRTVSLKNDAHTLVITADADTALYDGKPIPVTKPAKMYNGELYTAVDDFTKFFFIKSYTYNELGQLLGLQLISTKPIEGIDNSKRLTPVAVWGSPEQGEGYDVDKVWDNDLSTYYCTTGMDKFFIYDFGETVNVDKLAIAWYSGNLRKQYFDIYMSDDGQNWTSVLAEGVSGGKTTGLEFFKIKANGRYLKMVSNGNSTNRNGYNSILEVIPLTK